MGDDIPEKSTVPLGAIATPSFEELAAEQAVAPVEHLESLLGHPSAEDESAEEFALMLRAWRREGTKTADLDERRFYIDTDVVSMLFKGDTRALAFRRHILGKLLVISFMTLAELERWPLERAWG